MPASGHGPALGRQNKAAEKRAEACEVQRTLNAATALYNNLYAQSTRDLFFQQPENPLRA